MVPLVFNSEKQFDENTFQEYLLQTCQIHKEQGRALAFAFIVYDFENNTIQEILESRKYWTSLDKISGQYLSVFYINSNDNYYNRRQQEIYNEEIRRQHRNSRPGVMHFMTPITLKDTPLDKSIKLLKSEFELDKLLKTPFILFFQTKGDIVTDSFIVELKDEKLEDSFLELKRQIQNAVTFINKIPPENSKNHQIIFDQIRNGVIGANDLNFVKTKVIPKIGLIVSIIKFFAGG